MGYNLFIDDQIDEINSDTGIAFRDPAIIDPSRVYVAFKTVEEAIDYIQAHGCPEFISFDHDLGTYPDGSVRETPKLAHWLVEQDLNQPGFIPANFSYQIHSKNVNAAKNLSILGNYLKFRSEC